MKNLKSKQLQFFSTKKINFFYLNQDIKKLSGDKEYSWGLRLIFLLLLILLMMIVLYFNKIPLLIPFFYSLPWGIQRLAPKNYLFALFLICFFLSFINIVLASINRSENRLIAQMFVWTTFIINLMTLIYLFKIFSMLSVW